VFKQGTILQGLNLWRPSLDAAVAHPPFTQPLLLSSYPRFPRSPRLPIPWPCEVNHMRMLMNGPLTAFIYLQIFSHRVPSLIHSQSCVQNVLAISYTTCVSVHWPLTILQFIGVLRPNPYPCINGWSGLEGTTQWTIRVPEPCHSQQVAPITLIRYVDLPTTHCMS